MCICALACTCVLPYVHVHTSAEVRKQLVGAASLLPAHPGYWARAIKHSGKWLYPLNHLSSPQKQFWILTLLLSSAAFWLWAPRLNLWCESSLAPLWKLLLVFQNWMRPPFQDSRDVIGHGYNSSNKACLKCNLCQLPSTEPLIYLFICNSHGIKLNFCSKLEKEKGRRNSLLLPLEI